MKKLSLNYLLVLALAFTSNFQINAEEAILLTETGFKNSKVDELYSDKMIDDQSFDNDHSVLILPESYVGDVDGNITADLFQQPLNTGANMTVAINSSNLDQYEGGQIGAFYDLNGDGGQQCVGLETISTGFFGLALWGDDSFTTETDGLISGDVPQFAILFE